MSAVLVLAAVATVPLGGLAASVDSAPAQQTTEEAPGNESAADVAPGERLSGVLNVGEAELENDIDSRTFGIKVARAASEDAQADVVKEQLDEIEQRIAELEERKDGLDRARENGSLSEGAYQAQVAEVAARIEGTERLTNQSARTAGELPADLLEQKGINVAAIQTLKDRAEELGGQEVAEIARGIAGDSVGKAPGVASPGERGPPDTPGQADDTDRDDAGTVTGTDVPGTDVPGNETVGNETAGSDAGAEDGR